MSRESWQKIHAALEGYAELASHMNDEVCQSYYEEWQRALKAVEIAGEEENRIANLEHAALASREGGAEIVGYYGAWEVPGRPGEFFNKFSSGPWPSMGIVNPAYSRPQAAVPDDDYRWRVGRAVSEYLGSIIEDDYICLDPYKSDDIDSLLEAIFSVPTTAHKERTE